MDLRPAYSSHPGFALGNRGLTITAFSAAPFARLSLHREADVGEEFPTFVAGVGQVGAVLSERLVRLFGGESQ
jgi:hypothetical protein